MKRKKMSPYVVSDVEEPIFPEKKDELPNVITTTNLKEISTAQEKGHQIKIIKRVSNPKMYRKQWLFQNANTGEYIQAEGREFYRQYNKHIVLGDEWHEVMETKQYCGRHPDHYPWAAYILPLELQKGMEFYIPDLIEDVVSTVFWGVIFRAPDAVAVWDGQSYKIDEMQYAFACNVVG